MALDFEGPGSDDRVTMAASGSINALVTGVAPTRITGTMVQPVGP